MTQSLFAHMLNEERRALRRIVGDKAKKGHSDFDSAVSGIAATLTRYPFAYGYEAPVYAYINAFISEEECVGCTLANMLKVLNNSGIDDKFVILYHSYMVKLAIAYKFINSDKAIQSQLSTVTTDYVVKYRDLRNIVLPPHYQLSPDDLLAEFKTMCTIARNIKRANS